MQVKRLLEEFNGKVESLRRQRVFNKKRRSQWMEGLLAAEEMHKEHNCIQLVKEFYYKKVVSTQDFGEGFGAYIANKEVRV